MRSLNLLLAAFLILGSTSALAQFDIQDAREKLNSETSTPENLLGGKDGSKGVIEQVLDVVELDLEKKNPNYNSCTKDLEVCNLLLYKLASNVQVIGSPEYTKMVQVLAIKTTQLKEDLEVKRLPEYMASGNENLKDVLEKGKLGPKEFEKLFSHNENSIAIKTWKGFTKDPTNPVKILEYFIVENIRQTYESLANGTTTEAKITAKLINYNGFFIPTSGIKARWDKDLAVAQKKADLVKEAYIEEYNKINKIVDLKIEVK